MLSSLDEIRSLAIRPPPSRRPPLFSQNQALLSPPQQNINLIGGFHLHFLVFNFVYQFYISVLKNLKIRFYSWNELFRTAWEPYRFSYIHTLHVNQSHFHAYKFLKVWLKTNHYSPIWKNHISPIFNTKFQNSKFHFCFVSSQWKSDSNNEVAWLDLKFYY